jgi:hypothetical protein
MQELLQLELIKKAGARVEQTAAQQLQQQQKQGRPW